MKKIISFSLCFLMLFGVLTSAPFDLGSAIVASAANTSALRELIESIPDESEWDRIYIDYSDLKSAYDNANEVLRLADSPEGPSQSYIDLAAKMLRTALSAVKYHTVGLELSRKTDTANVGSTVALKAVLSPENAADEVKWVSGNDDIASVSSDGTVTFKKYSADGVTVSAISNGYSDSCVFTLKNPLDSVTLSQNNVSSYTGQTFALSYKAYGADRDAKITEAVDSVEWRSSAPGIVGVTSDGIVEAYGTGTAVVSVVVRAGSVEKTAECTVKVSRLTAITGLSLQSADYGSTVTAVVGQKKTAKVKVTPSEASIKELKWTSSSPDVAVVESSGVTDSISSAVVTAKAVGKTKITYSTTDGSDLSGYFYVEVKPQISALSVSPQVVVLNPGKTRTLTAKIVPADAGNQVINWSSDNDLVCSVDYKGTLTPKSVGNCYITAETTDGTAIKSRVFVRVADMATSVSLNKTKTGIKVGGTEQLKATVRTVKGDTYNEVKWTSSDTKKATVDQNGVVKGVYPGIVTIKAEALDGTERYELCTVTVTADVTGLEVPNEVTVDLGKTLKIKATITPEYATNKAVTWRSENTDIVNVSSDGTLTGVGVGKANVTCTTADGRFTATCAVSVVIPVTSVSIAPDVAVLEAGETMRFLCNIAPADATDKSVTWKSSNEDVATVDKNGLVTAVAGGKAVITCTSNSSFLSSSCTLTVTQKATGITFEKNSVQLYSTQSAALKASVLPLTASDRRIKWSTSEQTIATVSDGGIVTAVRPGTAVITATSVDGGFTAQCVVTVLEKINVEKVTLSTSEIRLNKGKTYALDVTVTPADASNKSVTWSSNAKSVATVDENGVVTGVGNGVAVITVTTQDRGIQAKCIVIVTQSVTGVVLNSTSEKISVGNSKALVATVKPDDSSNKDVKWTSSNPAVASVNENGVVTAKSAGTTTITVTTDDGGYTAFCNITVYTPATGIEISKRKITIAKGKTALLTATVLPKNAENREFKWSTSDKSIATINAAGQVTAKKVGTAIITATSVQGKHKAMCLVEVVQLATGVSLNYSSVTLEAGKAKALSASVTPLSASDKTVKWTSSNKKVATVNSKGVVTAVGAGSAVITATSGDGNASATCRINVTQKVKKLKFSESTYTVKAGSKITLVCKATPSTATETNYKWSSSNKKIATVSSSGVVKGINAGKVTITAKTQDGKVKATCTVKVAMPAKGITLSKSSVTLGTGKTTTVEATVKPSNATNKKVTWTSSNYDVADVSSSGRITAKKTGNAVITAKTKDGGFKATCRVRVITLVKGVSLNTTKKTLEIGDSFTLKHTIKPSKPTNAEVKWSTSNKKVATVSSKGVVKTKGTGTAKITVTTLEGGYTATCTVKVVRSVTGVKLNKKSLTVARDSAVRLKATVTPSNATNKALLWLSSNPKVAAVDQNGRVAGLKVGKATITVKTKDGSFKASCSVSVEILAEKLTLKSTKATVKSGQTVKLGYTVLPKNTTNKALTWSSSNKAVASVNKNGVVTGLKGGKVTITAKTSNGIAKKCTVTVIQAPDSVRLNEAAVSIYEGTSKTLKATVLPSNSNDKSVKWSSSNTKVATVSSKGVVKAVSVGTAVITVKTNENARVARCTVTVLRHTRSVTLDKSSFEINIGRSETLKATVLPETASEKGVKWTSSAPEIASVSPEGIVTGLAFGEAVITATTVEGGKKATCFVKVNTPVMDIVLAEAQLSIGDGESAQLEAIIAPEDATNKNIIWSTDAPEVATVDENGVVTGVEPGTAVITATTVDGGFTATAEITVFRIAKKIELNTNEVTVITGQTVSLSATVLPEDAVDKTVTWESSDNEVANVNDEGFVTTYKAGTAEITAYAAGGKVKSVCVLNVTEPVTGVTLEESELTLYSGSEKALTAAVLPESATNKKLIWSSNQPEVASVDENGVVSALSKGEAVITVKTDDGGFEKSCTVTVLIGVSEIVPDKTELFLAVPESVELACSVLPENADDKTLLWSSSNENVAKVDENGKVTAVSEGSAVITAASKDGQAKTEITVEVIIPAETVSVSAEKDILWVGESVTLSAAVLPENATQRNVNFVSLNENVAGVSEDGVVTAISAGESEIKVTSGCGRASAVFKITVRQQVEAITLSSERITLGEDGTKQLSATVLPKNAFDRSVKWISENEEVAAVSDSGLVTAVSKGETTVKAISSDEEIFAVCTVVVTRIVENIELSETELSLEKGSTFALSAALTPADATDLSVRWESSDTNVVTVGEGGLLTAVGAGSADITAYSSNEDVTAKCHVTVYVLPESLTLDSESADLWLDETLTLVPSFLPADTTRKDVEWSSDSKDVASVDDSGVVTALSKGTAVITAKSKDTGFEARCTVSVHVRVQSVSFDKEEYTVENGESVTLAPEVAPENASFKKLLWSSQNEEVATVDENGVVTTHSVGTAVIEAKTEKEGVAASCKVTVIQKPIEITLSAEKNAIYEGEQLSISAAFEPEYTTLRGLEWSVSNGDTAEITQDGLLTAKQKGVVTVTARSTANGEVFGEIEIEVCKKVTGFNISDEALAMYLGDEAKALSFEVLPGDATNKNIIWQTSDDSVVTVENGVITPVGAGTAFVFGTTQEGGYTDFCAVEIRLPIEKITLENDKLTLNKGEQAALRAVVEPVGAADGDIIWKSSNQAVATVENGVVTARATSGTAVITACSKLDESIGAECTVTVLEPVTSVVISDETATLRKGETKSLSAVIVPSNATDKSVTWDSDNTDVATVDENGVVTAVGFGTARITVTTADGGFTDVCAVKVLTEIDSVSLESEKTSLKVGEETKLTVKASPEEHDETFTFTSNDCVIVSQDGTVTAVKGGTAVITVKSGLSQKTAQIELEIIQPVRGVSFSNETLEMLVGFKGTLGCTVEPLDATDKTVTWESSAPEIVSVDENGNIDCLSVGEAVIKVTTADGGFTASCTITVK